MSERTHEYTTEVEWTGNTGVGTRNYRAYERAHTIRVDGKPELLGSSMPEFRGDASRYNPDELLVASLSACHLLWYLHLAAVNGVEVVAYRDRASGTMAMSPDGGGRFTEAILRPRVRIVRGDPERAQALHEQAHAKCFIANSVNFPVRVEPTLDDARPTATGRGSP